MMDHSGDSIKKRLKQREDMFLRRLFGMLAKMAKISWGHALQSTIQIAVFAGRTLKST